MRITYDGPFEAVFVPVLGIDVERGETVDVDEDNGASLVAQGWLVAPAAKAEPVKKAAAKGASKEKSS